MNAQEQANIDYVIRLALQKTQDEDHLRRWFIAARAAMFYCDEVGIEPNQQVEVYTTDGSPPALTGRQVVLMPLLIARAKKLMEEECSLPG